MGDDLRAAGTPGALQGLPHFAPTAKRVIYLFQSGGPAQMDLSTTSRGCTICAARSCPRRSGWGSG